MLWLEVKIWNGPFTQSQNSFYKIFINYKEKNSKYSDKSDKYNCIDQIIEQPYWDKSKSCDS